MPSNCKTESACHHNGKFEALTKSPTRCGLQKCLQVPRNLVRFSEQLLFCAEAQVQIQPGADPQRVARNTFAPDEATVTKLARAEGCDWLPRAPAGRPRRRKGSRREFSALSASELAWGANEFGTVLARPRMARLQRTAGSGPAPSLPRDGDQVPA